MDISLEEYLILYIERNIENNAMIIINTCAGQTDKL
jgi:hypothetical protein